MVDEVRTDVDRRYSSLLEVHECRNCHSHRCPAHSILAVEDDGGRILVLRHTIKNLIHIQNLQCSRHRPHTS